ncbi:MAG: hybrid sensor histidine kinase/response regulator [Alkalinema sp. CAN_BIN05]|nr:hybrid sensor histidine kinase/response regulator [Alkalinema sp. CAN_BIN05]
MSNGFILVVDDNPTNLTVISQALRTEGWQVRMAVDGEDALSKVAQNPPELILLDVQMPGIDGFEVCKQLKADKATSDIPIIFMTALSDTDSKVKGLALGAVDYIAKPFEQQEALARVRVHLQLRHLTQTLEQQVRDRTQALSQALEELQHSHLQVIQSEKMSALGNLVAGVAHEINNPIGCVVGNVSAVEANIRDLFGVIDLYGKHFPNPGAEIENELETVNLDYLREDLPKLVKAMRDGSDRIVSISRSLSTFSRADTDRKHAFNLHEGIDSTILILRHRLKDDEHRPEIQVLMDYGNLPLVECFPGQLNQVFMNILANAIDAVDELNQGRSFTDIESNPNRITIKTILVGKQVQISIADNGPGMPEEVRSRIFDHLYTTKTVGKGTGLGLAIAQQIIEKKHGGTIEVNSEFGKGATFIIKIPVLHHTF